MMLLQKKSFINNNEFDNKKKKKFSALFQIHPNILFVRFQFYIICLIVFPNTVPLSYNPSQIVPMLHVSCLLFMSICKNV